MSRVGCRFGLIVRVWAALAVAAGLLVWPGLPARAAIVEPLTLGYHKEVYGRFVIVGNGVLQCPPAGTPQNSWDSCPGGAARTDPYAVNDSFSMRYADVDGLSSTFNSSRASVTIPPGSTVDFAKLYWAGNTGYTSGSAYSPSCTAAYPPAGMPAAVYPPSPPGATSPASQSVRLTIGSGTQNSVAPGKFVAEPTPGGYNNAQYYSASADVTSLFAGVTGTQNITVGNVWTPEGFACFGGWSLTVVYRYDAPDPVYAPVLRDIYVYDGHVRQSASDPATTVTISGFRSTEGEVRAAVTAYEGDNGIAGDQFLINNKVMTEPATGATDNFFNGQANGALAPPGQPNNYSVDAKDIQVPAGVVKPGDTSAQLTFSTSGDSYLAQQVIFSVPLVEVRANKEVCQSRSATACTSLAGPWGKEVSLLPGDTAYWRITLTNPSGATATNVRIDDADEANCTSGGPYTIPAGATRYVYCSSTNLTGTTTNTARARFAPSPGAPERISPPSTATAKVASMTLGKEVCSGTSCGQGGSGPWVKNTAIKYGAAAQWRITVTNTGGARLTNVAVTDPAEPACATTVDLEPGETKYVYCSTANVTADRTNTASAVFPAPPGSPPGTPSTNVPPSSASVGVYDVQLTKQVCQSVTPADCQGPAGPWTTTTTGASGTTAYWRLVLAHRGTVPVTGITITDPDQASCAPGGTVNLAVAETKYFYCSTPNVTADKSNTATATYVPPGQTTSTSTSSTATYRIYGLTVEKQVCQSEVPANCAPGGAGPWGASANGPVGSSAQWRIVARNTGSFALGGITIADPAEPACSTAAGTFSLAAGASQAFYCSTGNVTENKVNSASGRYTPPGGTTPITTVPSTAQYNVYGLTLEKEVCLAATAAECTSGGSGTWAKTTTVPIGKTAYWRITTKNVGRLPLTGIRVSDATEATCQAEGDKAGAFTLTESDSRVLYCSSANLNARKVNTATATYTPPGGSPTTLTSSAVAEVSGVTVVKRVCTGTGTDCTGPGGPWAPEATGPVGSTAYWQITVTNIGSVPLSGVQVADPQEAGCVRTVDVPAGGSQVYYCSTANVTDNLTNTVKATVNGATVDGFPATYKVYGITANKEVCQSLAAADCGPGGAGPWVKTTVVPRGTAAYWRITVANIGDETVAGIALTDSTEPACQAQIDQAGQLTLAGGATRTFYCSTATVNAEKTNTVSGSFPPPGKPIGTTAQIPPSSATARVSALTAVKEVCSGTQQQCGPGGTGVWLSEATGPAGSTAYWRITVTNTGEVPLSGVFITDPAEPSCSALLAGVVDLAPGAQRVSYCSTANVTTDRTNTVTASYQVPGAPSGTPIVVTPPSSATYRVYGLTIRKESCSGDASNCGPGGAGPWSSAATGPIGSTAYWRITLVNTGTLDIVSVAVRDPAETSCATSVPILPAGSTRYLYCQTAAVTANKTNTATANYVPPGQGTGTSASSTATYRVYGMSLVKEVCTATDPAACTSDTGPWAKTAFQDPPDGGATAYWRIRLVNTGGVPLTGVSIVSVIDPAEPSCARTVELPVGTRPVDIYCSTSAVTTNRTNTALARYTPPGGGDQVSTPPDQAKFQTYGLLLSKEVCSGAGCPATGTWGPEATGQVGTTAYWRVRLTNNGGVALTGIQVSDPEVPGCSGGPITVEAGAEQILSCSTASVRADRTNRATATYTPPGTTTPVTLEDDAVYHVFGLEIVKEVCHSATAASCASGAGPWAASTVVPLSSTVYWRIRLTNNGSVDLAGVRVNDAQEASCVRTADVPAGQTVTVTCSSANLTTNKGNTATASYTVGTETKTTTPSTATATVYGMSVTKEVCRSLNAASCTPGGPGPWASAANLPAGSTVYWRIVVANTGAVPMTGVTVTDPAEASCAVPAAFDLQPGETKPFGCTTTNLTTDKVNVATANAPAPDGTPSGTPAVVVPSREAEAHPYGATVKKEVCLASTAAACSGPGPWGPEGSGPLNSTAYWRVTVTNTGTIPLTGEISDPAEPSCVQRGTLPGKTSAVFYCSTANLTQNRTNTATVYYVPPDGGAAVSTEPSSATYNIYGLTLAKQVCQSVVPADCVAGGKGPWAASTTVPTNGAAYWRIIATNAGATPLTAVTLSDAGEADCQSAIGTPFDLPVGASSAFYCRTASVPGAKTNTVTGTYTPPGKPPVTADPASAKVTTYSMKVLKEVCTSEQAAACGPGGAGPWTPTETSGPLNSTAYWRITVTNTGQEPLTGVSLKDAAEPSCEAAAASFDLPAGPPKRFYCSTADVRRNTTNTVTAQFDIPGGGRGETAPDSATFNVYGLTLVKEVCVSTEDVDDNCQGGQPGQWAASTTVPVGGTAYWRITATNIGNTPLTGITLTDTGEAACQQEITKVGPFALTEGDARVFYCRSTGVTGDKENTVSGRFTPPTGPDRDVPPSTAKVTTHGLTLVKEVCAPGCGASGSGAYGSAAPWRITVTNKGSVPLNPVRISDPAESSCAGEVNLAVGETKVITCTTPNVTGEKTNTATASYTPPGGKDPVTSPPSAAVYRVGPPPPTPTPSPTPVVPSPRPTGGPGPGPLPVSGTSAGPLLPAGALLIGTGGVLLWWTRNRRKNG